MKPTSQDRTGGEGERSKPQPSRDPIHDNDQAAGDAEALAAALEHFESALETPVVSGELQAWSETLNDACQQLDRPLRNELERGHPDQFADISSEDPELLSRVEQLRNEDAELLDQYETIRRRTDRFVERAGDAEPHEEKLDEHVSDLVDEGLALVIRIRKQQQAIKTWLLEAFQRDTGVAD